MNYWKVSVVSDRVIGVNDPLTPVYNRTSVIVGADTANAAFCKVLATTGIAENLLVSFSVKPAYILT